MEMKDWLEDDYYNLLGINQNADNEIINKAYRLKAKSTHPDTYPLNSIERDLADKKFKLLIEARDTLLDPDKRNEYDNQRLIKQECYLSYITTTYSIPVIEKVEKPKNSFKETLKQQMSKYEEDQEFINSNQETYHYEEEISKEEKSRQYKQEGAKRFYRLGMQYLMNKNYSKAMTYFRSAQYLDPTVRIPRQYFPD
ncbi:MAG: DnaJ domain-containing protein [Candidatus Sericytochromatia bacterium]